MDSRQYRSASRFCARLSAASPRLLSRNARCSRRTRASSTELRDSILAFARHSRNKMAFHYAPLRPTTPWCETTIRSPFAWEAGSPWGPVAYLRPHGLRTAGHLPPRSPARLGGHIDSAAWANSSGSTPPPASIIAGYASCAPLPASPACSKTTKLTGILPHFDDPLAARSWIAKATSLPRLLDSNSWLC